MATTLERLTIEQAEALVHTPSPPSRREPSGCATSSATIAPGSSTTRPTSWPRAAAQAERAAKVIARMRGRS